MSEFFKGWRRKIGSVMLLLACLCMVGWVRSRSHVDWVCIPNGNQTTEYFESRLSCMIWTSSVSRYATSQPQSITAGVAYYPNGRIYYLWSDESTLWWSLGQVFYEGTSDYRYYSLTYRVLPYSSIVYPLTLLSGWLLLFKPRQSTTQKSGESPAEKVD